MTTESATVISSRGQHMMRYLAPALLLVTTAFPALATDLFFRDLAAKSENGRYECTATSPDNREGPEIPFAKDFTIAFRDANTEEVLWTHKQREDEASPVQLIPTDDGHLIMQNAWDQLYVFDRQGDPRKVLDIWRAFPEDETERFTDSTTAGVMWAQYSKQGFFVDGSGSYFYIRTYWGRLVIIDIEARRWVQEPTIMRRVEDAIVQETRSWMRAFDNSYYSKCDSCGEQHLREDIEENAFIIKQYDLQGGRKLIKQVLKRSDSGIEEYLGRITSLGGLGTRSLVLGVAVCTAVAVVAGLIYVRRARANASSRRSGADAPEP